VRVSRSLYVLIDSSHVGSHPSQPCHLVNCAGYTSIRGLRTQEFSGFSSARHPLQAGDGGAQHAGSQGWGACQAVSTHRRQKKGRLLKSGLGNAGLSRLSFLEAWRRLEGTSKGPEGRETPVRDPRAFAHCPRHMLHMLHRGGWTQACGCTAGWQRRGHAAEKCGREDMQHRLAQVS
jgi:hypothetical protein